MKKVLLLAVVAVFIGTTAYAQIGESKSKKIETTYTTTTTTSVVPENPNYNRVYFGYAQTKLSGEGYSESLHGFNAGWLGGYNVTPAKKLPLYLETGIALNAGFGDVLSSSDKLLSLEVPINITYRYNIPNTKIRLSPYFGFHFKVNVLALDDDGDSYFDNDEFNRFQFGMQLGANFEYDHFYLGVGWNKDFLPFIEGKYYGETWKVNTSGARVNVGFVF